MGSQLVAAGAKAEAGGFFIDIFQPDSVVQGTWGFNCGSTEAYGQLRNTTTADGDEITYTNYMTTGEYVFRLLYSKDDNCGIIKVYVDSDLVLTQDSYNAADSKNNAADNTYTVTGSGVKTITIKVDGKNGASSDYMIKIQALMVRRIV
jgi:hypothetical protein